MPRPEAYEGGGRRVRPERVDEVGPCGSRIRDGRRRVSGDRATPSLDLALPKKAATRAFPGSRASRFVLAVSRRSRPIEGSRSRPCRRCRSRRCRYSHRRCRPGRPRTAGSPAVTTRGTARCPVDSAALRTNASTAPKGSAPPSGACGRSHANEATFDGVARRRESLSFVHTRRPTTRMIELLARARVHAGAPRHSPVSSDRSSTSSRSR